MFLYRLFFVPLVILSSRLPFLQRFVLTRNDASVGDRLVIALLSATSQKLKCPLFTFIPLSSTSDQNDHPVGLTSRTLTRRTQSGVTNTFSHCRTRSNSGYRHRVGNLGIVPALSLCLCSRLEKHSIGNDRLASMRPV